MYVFDRVTAKVVETTVSWQPLRVQFDFYLGKKDVPFSDAKKVADATFLEDRVAQLRALYTEQNVGQEVELTSETSKIRGYQGGLCHIAMMGTKPYLVLARRGADAPTSPLMLDIAAGRMDDTDESWEETMLREGVTELGYYGNRGKIIPYFRGQEVGRETSNRLRDAAINAYRDVGIAAGAQQDLQSVTRLFDQNDTYAAIRVHTRPGFQPETISAAWTALPHLSSIELLQHIPLHLPRGTTFSDLEYDRKAARAVHRDIYVIDIATGNTQVWNAGQKLREEDLSILLGENRNALQQLFIDGKITRDQIHPVSPKVVASITQLPGKFTKYHNCSELEIMTII